MKKSTFILVAVVFLVIGYLVGNFFPMTSSSTSQNQESDLPQTQGIQGDTILQVTVIMDMGTPVANIEVDLAETPGPPPVGGVGLTDEFGIANFSVKPGNYFVFFNDTNFPENLENPGSQPITVQQGMVNQETITLTTK